MMREWEGERGQAFSDCGAHLAQSLPAKGRLSFPFITCTSRNSYGHALRGKKDGLDAKPQACFGRVIPVQRSCLSL